MTRIRLTGQGEFVPLSAEEEAAADAIETLDAKEIPMKEWQEAMLATDVFMTRAIEDLIDSLLSSEIVTEDQLSAKLIEFRTLKKNERNKKPQL
jgi:hypothetical protein